MYRTLLFMTILSLAFLPLAVEGDSSKSKKGEVTASRLNVRTGPSTKYRKIFSLPRGTKVTLVAKKKGWYKIRVKGKTGWVSGKYIGPVTEIPRKGKKYRLKNGMVVQDIGKYKITFYWMIHEKNYKGPANTPIYNKKGQLIGRFPKKFVKHLRLEGTAKLKDGRVLNVAGKGKFSFVKAPYGLGVRNIPLQPFRSIAVDRKIIPIGTKIFIPQARGVRLPDGTVHDGIFYAHDVGGGIKGYHIDVFTGAGDQRKILEKAGIKNLRKTRLYLILKK